MAESDDSSNSSNSLDVDAPITSSYASDIVLLSSWLHGQDSRASHAEHRDKTHHELSILTHLATILTIGNQNAPKAHNVHAVIGLLQDTTIECLVFLENTALNRCSTPSNMEPGPSDVQRVQLKTRDPVHGQTLLANWANERWAPMLKRLTGLLTLS